MQKPIFVRLRLRFPSTNYKLPYFKSPQAFKIRQISTAKLVVRKQQTLWYVSIINVFFFVVSTNFYKFSMRRCAHQFVTYKFGVFPFARI